MVSASLDAWLRLAGAASKDPDHDQVEQAKRYKPRSAPTCSSVYEVSCGAAGSCSAGGFYTDGSGHGQAFVVSQHNGTWNHAEKVPGTSALNAGGDAVTSSVSCASAGNFSAVGSYKDRSGHHQAFIAIQAR